MELLKVLALFFSSVGYISFICLYGRVRVTVAPLIFCSFVTLFLYVFAIFGFLNFGATLCLAVGVVLGALVAKSTRGLVNLKDKRYLVCVFFLIPFFAFYISIDSGYLFTGWDEYSFWALSIKLIYETGSLYNETSPVAITFKAYPPAQQLFQFYVVKFSFWSEKNVLFAQIFFLLSALLCVCGSFVKRRILLCLVMFLVSCGCIYFFKFDFTRIYVDQLLAVYLAAVIAIAMNEEGLLGWRSAAIFSVVLMVLVLIKQIGLVLALIAVAISFVNRVLAVYYGGSSGTEIVFKKLAPVLISTTWFFVAIGLAFKSWSLYVEHIHSARSFAVPNLAVFFQEPLLQRLGTTVVEFMARIRTPGVAVISLGHDMVEFSITKLTILLTCVSFCLIFTRRAQRFIPAAVFSLLLLGSIGYLAFLLLSYLVFFSEYEGVRLVSFERYVATYYLAWFLVVYGFVCGSADKAKRSLIPAIVGLLSIGMLYFVPVQFFIDARSIAPPATWLAKRDQVDHLAYVIKTHIQPGEKAYFINQNSTGYEKYAFSYAMLPYDSLTWCWSLGEKYYEGDIWTCPGKLESAIKDYAFVALYDVDARFWNDNGYLFSSDVKGIKTGVFKVNKENNVVVSLSLVE